MIIDSFDNKTEPVMSIKDFYGDKKEIIDDNKNHNECRRSKLLYKVT